jgi:hypothetical protein
VLLNRIDSAPGELVVQADATGAAVRYDTLVGAVRKRRAGLITFASPGIDVLATVEQGHFATALFAVGLSAHTVVWQAGPICCRYTFNRRARTGGSVTTVPMPFFGKAGVNFRAVTDDQVAAVEEIRKDGRGPVHERLWVRNAKFWRVVTLPGATASMPGSLPANRFGGLAAAGSQFFVAVSGDARTTAGVYAIGAGSTATRVASVGPDRSTVQDVSLSAGRVTYTEFGSSAGDHPRSPVWHRPVTRDVRGRIVLGAEHTAAPGVAVPPSTDLPLISFSAGRGAVLSGERYRLLDRGVQTAPLDGSTGPLRSSGPFTVLGTRVFRADGTTAMVLNLPLNPDHSDIFGSRVIYSSGSDVTVQDVAQPATRTNPVVVGRIGTCDLDRVCAAAVAIRGSTVAWTALDGTIMIRILPSAAVRVVHPVGTVAGLRLSEGALTWFTRGTGAAATPRNRYWLLDLRSPSSVPVAVPGLQRVSVDDHLLAGVGADGRLSVRALPFGLSTRYPPRLIGVLAPASFSPDGVTTWAPQVDVTKPVRQVALTLRRAGTVVRVLTGTGPDGSVRDLSWDGTDALGRPAPLGGYTWTLTAVGVDGEGFLTAADARSAVTGRLTVTR